MSYLTGALSGGLAGGVAGGPVGMVTGVVGGLLTQAFNEYDAAEQDARTGKAIQQRAEETNKYNANIYNNIAKQQQTAYMNSGVQRIPTDIIQGQTRGYLMQQSFRPS